MILRDVDKDDLRGILRFMYHGEVQIPEDRLKEFLKTAETLQVRGLGDGEAERCDPAEAESGEDAKRPAATVRYG